MYIIATCLVAIPTPVNVLLQSFNVTNAGGAVEENDVRTLMSPYEFCRFCLESTDDTWNNLTQVITFNVTEGDIYYNLSCDSINIGKCAQM